MHQGVTSGRWLKALNGLMAPIDRLGDSGERRIQGVSGNGVPGMRSNAIARASNTVDRAARSTENPERKQRSTGATELGV